MTAKLIFNLIANVALVVMAIHFVSKFYRYVKHGGYVTLQEWIFMLTCIVIGGCSITNLVMKSNPIGSEVLQNVCLTIFLYILLREPKNIANILDDDLTTFNRPA